jgi:hypothetical protein
MISAKKVITDGYEDSGYNLVMKGFCYSATGGRTSPLYNLPSVSLVSYSSDI